MDIQALLDRYGALGVLVAMFLESSLLPLPSEAVIVAAGYLKIPLGTIVWAGAVGSTLGGCVGYALGRSGVRWLLDRYGRWLGLTQERLNRLDALAKRYGTWSVLIGRLIPVVPFKVFSIGAGISKIAFGGFVLMTFVGVIPRLVILAVAGEWLRRATIPTVCVLVLIGGIIYLRRRVRLKSCSGLRAGGCGQFPRTQSPEP